MEAEEIKKEVESLYTVIKDSNKRLEELRKLCKHEKTYEGLYSWRIGAIDNAEMCNYCGKVIRFLNFKVDENG